MIQLIRGNSKKIISSRAPYPDLGLLLISYCLPAEIDLSVFEALLTRISLPEERPLEKMEADFEFEPELALASAVPTVTRVTPVPT